MKCEFSLEHYKECIELAKDKGYMILPIKHYNDPNYHQYPKNSKTILLRHDVDFSLEYAYELANFEYDLGINSSYYIYLHSELYNALSPKSMGMIREMKDMGHEIGLHTEGTNYIMFEEELLDKIFNKPTITSYTSHLWNLRKPLIIPSLTNPQTDIKIKYISDSGRNWREGCMCNHIGKINKLHILIHPEWWVSNGVTREDAVHKLWQSNLQSLVRNMTDIKQMLVEYVRDDLKQ